MSGKENKAPNIKAGTVSIEVTPDLKRIRDFANDFVKLCDRYFPESVSDVTEADGSARSPEEGAGFRRMVIW